MILTIYLGYKDYTLAIAEHAIIHAINLKKN